jgi:hypothetical protein
MLMAIDNNIHTRTSHNIILIRKENFQQRFFFNKNQQLFCENISRE